MLKLIWKISRIPGVSINKVYKAKDRIISIISPDRRIINLARETVSTCGYNIKDEGYGICNDDCTTYYLYISK